MSEHAGERPRPDAPGEAPGSGAGPTPDAVDEEDGYEAPVGTLFLLMVYVMVLAGMWVTMYWLLVSR